MFFPWRMSGPMKRVLAKTPSPAKNAKLRKIHLLSCCFYNLDKLAGPFRNQIGLPFAQRLDIDKV